MSGACARVSVPRGWPAVPLLLAAPAMVASAALLLVVFGWAGGSTGMLVTGWTVLGLGLGTSRGEAVILRWRRCRHLGPADALVIEPPWAAAVRRCGLNADAYRLHIRAEAWPNAYAVGRHSVIVTTGLVHLIRTRRVTAAMAEAILVHELGHLVTGSVRYRLVVRWLTAPWRSAWHIVLGLLRAGNHRGRTAVATAIAAIASAQSARHGDYRTTTLFTVIGLGVLTPLVEAAADRRNERVADQYAVRAGVGHQLADAVAQINELGCRQRQPLARLRDRHPAAAERTAALRVAAPLAHDRSISPTGPSTAMVTGRPDLLPARPPMELS